MPTSTSNTLKSVIQALEAAKFDAFFMADHLAVLNMPIEALKRSHTVTSFEPFTLLSALSQVTERIGLAATASTTYDEPYHIARRFASLDHLSEGRAAWNIVTTGNPESSKNFGLDEHVQHSERYKRAREFYDVVTGLWDSCADDAFIRDPESLVYIDPEKIHTLNHKGDDLQVKGPLNIARPVQGWPVIVQAGESEPGRQLAAETAELLALKQLAENVIISRILPAAMVLIGDSVEDAQQKRLRLDSLVHYDSAISSLSIALGTDASKFNPDGPIPSGDELPETNASHTSRTSVISLAKKDGLTIRQLAGRYGGYAGLAFVGTAETVADKMQRWLEEEASNGFMVTFPFLPEGLEAVTQKLVPELQRRGVFRQDYQGTTLREYLGLPRHRNQFFNATSGAEIDGVDTVLTSNRKRGLETKETLAGQKKRKH
ncbi:hypothetical protein N0V83_004308 [Neocucurbitaria cava]|uniref:Luciferase-like domain-containing protein n=1 Tax=Neocucurbitaria cava TaxID=798079 RepID=A0A9W9CNZ4_9PLEO|nr:hypothetical protein N0V83_004308 [Neocucurbitaria cava]